MSDDKKLKIIYRDIVIKKHKIIRIVDFFGSFEHQEQLKMPELKCVNSLRKSKTAAQNI